MKDTTRHLLLASALVGALCAVATSLVMNALVASRTDEDVASGDVAPKGADLGKLAREVRAVREALRAVEERVELLELRPEREARAPLSDSITREELDALRKELLAAIENGPEILPPGQDVKAQVATALEDVRREERVAKSQRALESKIAKAEQWLATLTEWLELDPVQAEGMRELIARKDQRDQELLRMWEDGVEDEVLAETKRLDHEEIEDSIERLLTPAQLETYRSKIPRGK